MPFANLSAGRVHYTDQGSGPPLILLHANPGDGRDFAAIVPALSAFRRVMALDWPGYGQSTLIRPPQDADVLLLQAALREFIDVLGLDRPALLGNSVGGLVAARLALSEPSRVSALVLVGPGGFTPHGVFTRTFCRLQGSRWSLPTALFARAYLRRRNETVRAMLERAATDQSRVEQRELNRALWRNFLRSEADLRSAAAALEVPTLLIFGERDPAIPAHRDGRVAAASIPQAEFVTLPCGHAPFAEMPEAFLTCATAFLGRRKDRAD